LAKYFFQTLKVFSTPLVAFQCAMKKRTWNAIVVLGNSSDAKFSRTQFFVSEESVVSAATL
jgi:hypothetical protein